MVQDQDYSNMWKVVGSLNGRPDSTPANEAMLHNEKTITSNMKKADFSMSHYTGISRLSFSREERDKNRLLKTWLRAPTVDEEGTADFSIEELKRAIKYMKTKGAAGPDDFQPIFLKELGQETSSELLTLFNMSFNTGKFPQEWQNAVIIPLLKAGKPSSKVASSRPVSLTSCIVKTLERIIAARISYLAETNNWFSDNQAGFRRGRSCEDQVIRMSQSVSDGFQKKTPERTVMALLGFSRAYDRVCRQDLLLSMLEKGVPRKFLRWIAGFLQNRQGRVLFANSLNRHRTIRQGVPQGFVLAPTRFSVLYQPSHLGHPSRSLVGSFRR